MYGDEKKNTKSVIKVAKVNNSKTGTALESKVMK